MASTIGLQDVVLATKDEFLHRPYLWILFILFILALQFGPGILKSLEKPPLRRDTGPATDPTVEVEKRLKQAKKRKISAFLK